MNKTDRMLAIVLELQRRRTLRAEDLAAAFETSVRTIYRDMQALSEAGVPIVGSPGQGYSLMEGYFLPPVRLAAEEAVALLLGADLVAQRFSRGYGENAGSAMRKIEAVLPEPIRAEAARARRSFRLVNDRGEEQRLLENAHLETLQLAIAQGRKVKFRYVKKIAYRDGSRESVRVAAPYGLVLVNGAWVLVARCELREDIRHFRLSRMAELAMLETPYALPDDFRLSDYTPPDDRRVRVRVQLSPGIVDRVRESNNYFLEEISEREGTVVADFRVRQPEELLQWLLGWGAEVTVLEPASLRTRIRDEAEKLYNNY